MYTIKSLNPFHIRAVFPPFLFGGGESRIAIGIPYGIALQLGEAIADCARHIQREMEK